MSLYGGLYNELYPLAHLGPLSVVSQTTGSPKDGYFNRNPVYSGSKQAVSQQYNNSAVAGKPEWKKSTVAARMCIP